MTGAAGNVKAANAETTAAQCWTGTTTTQAPTCKPFETSACVPIQCFRAETSVIPCHDPNCPTTTTEATFTACQTECIPACPTVTFSCGTMV